MGTENTTVDVTPDVTQPSTMADSRCLDCYGKGILAIILPGQKHALSRVCHCVIEYLKKNPRLAIEFLKYTKQIH